jgi:hypothetical protein
MFFQVFFDIGIVHFFTFKLTISIQENSEARELLKPSGRPGLPFGHSQINELILYLITKLLKHKIRLGSTVYY